ncbi:A-kinase anchor protein SPHKAP isoform 5 [Mus musculus]|uniref:A-kinase anchor protein SPHKAP isoform 5 n=1 Tax=Mus musculus TaxID=10090 RepID=UPI000058AF71|nr:A-kinase anchor protein SPHKAP isoform 5 [Mus musculus]|eukprot:XP_006496640.1 PREDICTED: A-kinase anchor protein SPHKAP isoform X3 [Mus musculus]
MDVNSRLSVQSNVESPLMHEGSEPQQITSSAAGNLAGSITACKKVLRSNSLLESTDYWLQNQRTPCQIGFVEDESENCASVCFVNLDVNKDACITENLQQKLVNVSPDLPNLISSMNVQQPKENEIVLLSGLASGNLQADFDVSQCPWLPDICLVQCARGNRPNSTNCIIFEINKFLIGLEVVQERQLHLETNVLKLEDDTNCSLSSIEEDFLTASEHLEEEIEVDDCRSGLENTNVSANVLESKKPKETTQEGWDYHKEKLHCALGEKHIRKHRTPSTKTEGSKENTEENTSLKSLNRLVRPSHLKSEVAGNKQLATNYSYPENIKGELETSQMLFIPRDAYLSMVKKDVLSPCSVLSEQGGSHRDHDVTPNPLPPVQNGEASTGEYATNLAESVMQDAFIRLSQSQPTLPQESAVSFSMRSALLPSGCCTKDMVVPRSWNELPKIVIVQSPDGSDTVPEPNVSSWPDMEFVETSGIFSADSSSRPTQSALEVALACAATVIGTISSPQATERFAMEQESLVSTYAQRGTGVQQTQVPQAFMAPSTTEYSFPSALCGMTQVASAVAVCGLCEKEEATCPVAPTDLLPTSGASEEISSIGSLVMERSTELGKEAIAEALLREATLILARPDAYSSLGELLESVNQRIIETTSKTQTLCTESVQRNELAHTLSNVILKHSVDELHQKTTMAHPTDERHPCGTLDTLMESVNQLLHNVICFTFKKMNHIVTLSEHPSFDQAAGQAWVKAFACPSSQPLSNAHGTGLVIRNLVEDASPKSNKGGARPELVNNPRLQSEFSCSHRMFDSTAKSFPKEIYLKGIMGEDTRNPHHTLNYDSNERRASTDLGKLTTASEGCSGFQETEDSIVPNTQEKYICATPLNNEAQVNLSLLGDDLSVPAQSTLEAKQSEVYGITDFAEELAETVVSMATEIAAICLDNSNGKQPWFCAWKRGNEFLTAPNGSCRSLKRKKENSSAGSTVRKHKPPRLSEIKRKADEHPELKEKLMNRVMDESMNLEDIPDSVSTFANEVAAKIMNLTEFSMVDGVWQGQSCSRTRLLGGDRWNRLKASSCESIPEEDSEARVFVNSLGLMSTLSQPVSRASSVSKQSSCESITDEFSRFMVKQMENEGRGFELLLDYYAGKNASSIMSSAMQQACQKNDHLNVRPSCPSKQSSTESITEEFYRYMLRDIAKESKDGASSRRSSHDWTTGLLSPSTRSPLCYRQSSMPDSRSPCSRLTVNAPVKANSLDGFAQNCPQDSVNVQPVSRASSSGLCKSDSCLYRRSGTDQITNMLIHETWASSIEALMRKNKIIADDSEAANASPGPVSSGSPLQVEKNANRLATSKGHRGPTLLVQESVDYQRKDAVTEGNHSPVSSPGKTAPVKKPSDFDPRRETSACHNAAGLNSPRRSLCSRDVPLIQIETDQKEECIGEPGPFLSQSGSLEETEGHQPEETIPDVARNEDTAPSTCQSSRDSLETSGEVEVEVLKEDIPRDESRNPPSSSEESTGSWSQLANEEDIPDDTSSFLQLSERSMSNGNSSGTSSLGIMDLDIYQESIPSSPMINELVEEKEILKEQSESIKEHASGLPGRAASPQRSLLVINFDLEPECPDAELRATLQWIAASELGIPTIYFKKSQESRIEKFLDVVKLVQQKSWKVGDIFHAVVQYCKLHAEQKERTPSLFDWLLELG